MSGRVIAVLAGFVLLGMPIQAMAQREIRPCIDWIATGTLAFERFDSLSGEA